MIKKLVTLAALAMLLGSPTSYADLTTGNVLAADCEKNDSGFQDGFCYGYVFAVFDSIQGKKVCAPKGVSGKQLVSIAKKYLKENPENLHEPADELVTIALRRAFPC
jgi:hypothetical protein